MTVLEAQGSVPAHPDRSLFCTNSTFGSTPAASLALGGVPNDGVVQRCAK